MLSLSFADRYPGKLYYCKKKYIIYFYLNIMGFKWISPVVVAVVADADVVVAAARSDTTHNTRIYIIIPHMNVNTHTHAFANTTQYH